MDIGILMPNDFEQILDAADKFQARFIDPALQRMDDKLDAHLVKQDVQLKGLVDLVAKHDQEINIIKANQGRFMKGAAVYASAVGIAVGVGWGWIKSHFTVK